MLAKDAGAQLTGDVVRRGGADRYETAVELSKNQFSSGVEVADIATGTTFPDALVAGPGAGSRGPGGRQSDTRGGEPGAGAPAASTDRRSGRTSHRERWRHDLAQGVQREHRQTLRGRPLRNGRRDIQGPVRPRVPVTYIATGVNYPDSLAAGAAGARLGGSGVADQDYGSGCCDQGGVGAAQATTHRRGGWPDHRPRRLRMPQRLTRRRSFDGTAPTVSARPSRYLATTCQSSVLKRPSWRQVSSSPMPLPRDPSQRPWAVPVARERWSAAPSP